MSWLVDVVPPIERARVVSALESCSLLSLPRGASLGAARFDTVPFVAIEDGIVFVSAGNQSSARRIIVSLTGPASILAAPVGAERVEALVDARLTLIPARALGPLLDVPATAAVIVEAVGNELRTCRESLAQLGSRQTDRVREKLVQLAHAHGKIGTDGLLLDLPLTHELLADMVGSTRETVTRSLAQLADEGLITHARGRYLLAGSPKTLMP